ncbi:hypothetical protein ES332_A13G095500v1 [Gossypium tomentosum]|uniref:X8 domain-containing protein n=1 Tax=Gossypium tomentosum TaxID=34277 RepID=A0A5D2MIA4_GOSTO|nr:hypothetical protein ES332_A13G095500v1 [Gossypium tomentosum]
MSLLISLLMFLAMTGHSSATYCLCRDGLGDQALQKTLDYACGAGADCSAILQKGGCYNPNTVKDHCNYAVNSYFQKKGQAQGSCDFSGTATVSADPPSNIASTCSFPSRHDHTNWDNHRHTNHHWLKHRDSKHSVWWCRDNLRSNRDNSNRLQ